METTLEITNCEQNHVIFSVVFKNNSDEAIFLPVETIQRNGARVGFCFRQYESEIEPIEFNLIAPRTLDQPAQLPVGEKLRIDFFADIEHKDANVFALRFNNATYKILRRQPYHVVFVWSDTKTNEIEWQFDR